MDIVVNGETGPSFISLHVAQQVISINVSMNETNIQMQLTPVDAVTLTRDLMTAVLATVNNNMPPTDDN